MSEPIVVVKGIKEKIEKDLEKHKSLLEQTGQDLIKFRSARSHEIKRKKHYNSLIGGDRYNDDALRESIQQSVINIKHMSDKCNLAEEKIKHHQQIISVLSQQLTNQEYLERQAELYYQDHPEERPDGDEYKLGR